MKRDDCGLTAQTIKAGRDGNWSEALKAHAASCETCRMARWMGGLARSIEARSGPLPDPELIWLKASIRKRSQPPERALLPIRAAQWFGAGGLGLLFAGNPGWLGNLLGNSQEIWRAGLAAIVPDLSGVAALLAGPQTVLWLLPAGFLLLLLFAITAGEA